MQPVPEMTFSDCCLATEEIRDDERASRLPALKAEILRLSAFEIQSIVQLRNVKAEYRAETSTLEIEVALDDVQDGRHILSRSVPPDRAKPAGTEVIDLRTVQGSRVERTLRALRGFAVDADIQVSLDELRADLYETEAEERDLQRRLENLKEREDITTWSFVDGNVRATLSGARSDRTELINFTP